MSYLQIKFADSSLLCLTRNVYINIDSYPVSYTHLDVYKRQVAHSLEDVKYLESVGVERVVLAREVTVEEIKYICDNCKADIEVFVHGALCVCYSGQCLMSSMIGNRSGNRGRCAQPCRQRYELIDVYTGEVVNSNGDYLLSPRDLNAIEEIDKVIDAGVHSLKIEGRMKRPEYVATVIAVSYTHLYVYKRQLLM